MKQNGDQGLRKANQAKRPDGMVTSHSLKVTVQTKEPRLGKKKKELPLFVLPMLEDTLFQSPIVTCYMYKRQARALTPNNVLTFMAVVPRI